MNDDSHFRRSAREPVELRVRYCRDEAGAALEKRGQLMDLSMGGALVKCETPPSVGERLKFFLSSPSAWDPLELPAQVRWVDDAEGCFGVEFAALRRRESAALYELLAISRFSESS